MLENNNTPQRRRFVLAPIIIAIIVIAFQYFSANTYTNPITGKTSKVALSADQESALGLQSFNQVLSQSEVINSGADYDMVVRVVNKLIPQVDEESKKFEWSVSLVRSDEVNAFCLPGGKIVVYTGILPIARNDAGLATVLGHEIAHATGRHGSQRIFQQNLYQTAMTGISTSMSDMDMGERRTLLGLLGAGAQFGILLPFGRDHETEADEMGLYYMMNAGYDPNEAVGFWERMEKTNKKAPPEWMSTHPSNGTRISRLKDLIEKYKKAS